MNRYSICRCSSKRRSRPAAAGRLLLLVWAVALAAAWARGVQSDNHVLDAVPAPARVTIDGDLSEWDRSGRIVVCRDVVAQLGRYSAEVAMMYDAEALYVGVDWCDPTPLVNNYDPRFDVDLRRCFHSDSLQIHFRTDQERKVIGWFYTRGGVPAVCSLDGWFPWHDDRPIPYIDGLATLGITEAFRPKADGTGYVQELRIPWPAVVRSGRAYRAGESFEAMLDLVWGPDSGKGWPVNHMMDLVATGANHAGWFWEVNRIYGQVRLAATGNLSLPEPDFLVEARASDARLQTTEGPVALAYTMPFEGFATLVIEDRDGRRVRNLIGMAPRHAGRRTDFWDGIDEGGRLAPPGEYRFRGLVHRGIEPVYEATYGTPGVPPWDTADGTGAWLSDHCAPRAVACGGNTLVLAAERAESGCAIIATDLDGRKRWGDAGLAGIDKLAADDRYAYVFLRSWDVPPALARLDLASGRYAPFDTSAGPRLKVPLAADGTPQPWVGGFAVTSNCLALSLTDTNGLSVVRFFDAHSAAKTGDVRVPKPGCLAFDTAGVLHVWTDGQVAKLVDGRLVPVITEALPEWANAMAVDANGRIFLSDPKAQQVRLYDRGGRFVNAIGKPGGRPRTGAWQPDGLLNPAALAVDPRGRVWVAEDDAAPKRISVWSPEGRLERDFIGPTQYGGGGANADPDDKTRVFGSGCEFKLDYRANRAQVVAALGPVAGQLLKARGREYVMSKEGALFLRTGDALRRVAAMGNVCVKDLGSVAGIPLPPPPAGTHGYATIAYVWSDRNDDGRAQADEVASGSQWSGWNALQQPVGVAGYFGSCWLDDDFNLYGFAGESYGAYGGRKAMVTKTPLQGWSPGGAPRWDLARQQVLATPDASGCLYLPAEGRVVVGAPLTCIRDDGAVLWTYADNWSGVHGSHWAPLPDRDDVLIGTLGCIGKAGTALGTVFAMHSNMGRLYLMTLDGLLVASVFQDCRLGGDSWPREARPGAPLGRVTMGSEWFGGHFFRARDGRYYLIAGFTAYNLIRLDGFESLRAIRGGKLTFTAEALAEAERLAQRRARRAAAPAVLTIPRVKAVPAFDGRLGGFPTNGCVTWSAGPYTVRAALALDAASLYLGYDVAGDDNPMVNAGKDVNQLFVTGDSVDLQLGTDAAADTNRTSAAVGDLRLLISVYDGKPVAVLYRWKTPGERRPVTFTCPWRSATVDRVEIVETARINLVRRGGGYVVEAAVPLEALGFTPQTGRRYRIDLGAVYSDAKGDNRAARVYWSNKATGLVADVPGEILATPNQWGTAEVVGGE